MHTDTIIANLILTAIPPILIAFVYLVAGLFVITASIWILCVTTKSKFSVRETVDYVASAYIVGPPSPRALAALILWPITLLFVVCLLYVIAYMMIFNPIDGI